jgi:hypothetical protein
MDCRAIDRENVRDGHLRRCDRHHKMFDLELCLHSAAKEKLRWLSQRALRHCVDVRVDHDEISHLES